MSVVCITGVMCGLAGVCGFDLPGAGLCGLERKLDEDPGPPVGVPKFCSMSNMVEIGEGGLSSSD